MEKLLVTELNENQMKKTGNEISAYSYLNKINDIDDLFRVNNSIILFFEVESMNEGHWTCLIKRQKEYEFFDSYGLQIDGEFKYITKSKRIELNEQYDRLSQLLNDKRKQGYKILHNPHKIQAFSMVYNGKIIHPETCGRHTCLRLLNKNYSLDDFIVNVYDKNKVGNENDDIVSCKLIK